MAGGEGLYLYLMSAYVNVFWFFSNALIPVIEVALVI